MASGKPVVQILEIMPPAANAATFDTITGGSTPAEVVGVWDFDSATAEYLDFKCALAGYDGGGLTLTLVWSSDTTSGNVVWRAAVRRMADDAEDIDASHSYTYNSATDATASAAGEVAYTTITFTDGVDMDSWENDEMAILRIGRDATNGSDTMNSNDAELWGWFCNET